MGLKSRVQGLGFRVYLGLGSRVQSLGFRVWGIESTWTLKVGEIMAFMAVTMGFGPLSCILGVRV